MGYWALNDADYTGLRKDLLKEKGSTLQQEFIAAAKSNSTFIAQIDQRIGLEKTGEPFKLLAEPLSEGEYKALPLTMEQQLFAQWAGIMPAQASEETFWGYVTLEHIRQGRIESGYLAANGGDNGEERIDKALSDADVKSTDGVIRTILRRLGGLPERGRRSLYVDCPFARAWWRGYVAQQVCEETGAAHGKVAKVLGFTPTYWEKLIVLIVSRNAVLGDSKVRSALIWALSEWVEDDSKQTLFQSKTIQRISRQIGIRCAWQELGAFEARDLKQMIEQDFLPDLRAG